MAARSFRIERDYVPRPRSRYFRYYRGDGFEANVDSDPNRGLPAGSEPLSEDDFEYSIMVKEWTPELFEFMEVFGVGGVSIYADSIPRAAWPHLTSVGVYWDDLALYDVLTQLPCLEALSVWSKVRGLDLSRFEHLDEFLGEWPMVSRFVKHGSETITRLYLDQFNAASLEPLSGFPNLSYLCLFGAFKSVQGIGAFSKLEEIRFVFPKLLSLDGIEKATALQIVDISNKVAISDISPLAALPNLRDVRLDGFRSIATLEPFREHPTLKLIGLWDTRIENPDISVLLEIPNLYGIGLDDDPNFEPSLETVERTVRSRTESGREWLAREDAEKAPVSYEPRPVFDLGTALGVIGHWCATHGDERVTVEHERDRNWLMTVCLEDTPLAALSVPAVRFEHGHSDWVEVSVTDAHLEGLSSLGNLSEMLGRFANLIEAGEPELAHAAPTVEHSDELARFERWYVEMADADSEFAYGVGVSLEVSGSKWNFELSSSLEMTQPWENFDPVSEPPKKTGPVWTRARVRGDTFKGSCGPQGIGRLLQAFNTAANPTK